MITTTDLEATREKLRGWYPKDSTVYSILRSVSRSGMSRTISPLAILPGNGQPSSWHCALTILHPAFAIADVIGARKSPSRAFNGLIMQGCGMDMGFEMAYRLASALYDGDGYALNHRWL